jgi:hypothetical protein
LRTFGQSSCFHHWNQKYRVSGEKHGERPIFVLFRGQFF